MPEPESLILVLAEEKEHDHTAAHRQENSPAGSSVSRLSCREPAEQTMVVREYPSHREPLGLRKKLLTPA